MNAQGIWSESYERKGRQTVQKEHGERIPISDGEENSQNGKISSLVCERLAAEQLGTSIGPLTER